MQNHSTNTLNDESRTAIRDAYLADEAVAVNHLIKHLDLSPTALNQTSQDAVTIIKQLRASKSPGLMEVFLAEYGLSTEEGVALMCLAEALLRVPDDSTIDDLINDKIASANWSRHLGHSTSPLVNTSTWALMLTGKVIDSKETKKWDISNSIHRLIRRIGEPLIRKAVAQSMKVLGHQFVLGRDIKEAIARARGMETKGYTYSYDMLGEAAHTAEDAQQYFMSYSKAIAALSDTCSHSDCIKNPGISVKLSALHPRYEFTQKSRIIKELVPRVASLVHLAKNANMGFNIDAEEADRLDLSLDIIEAVLSNPDLEGWHGFGVVIQAYSPRATYVLDWLYTLAKRYDRRIMVRLVKGAYWDSEIKQAQVDGLSAYPVFTRKASTDISYLSCAKKLLSMTDRLYPQFATHNAHTVAAILNLAGKRHDFEFQRLHGMGESLYEVVRAQTQNRCRIYAPVGIHQDLLAYLVRRLLENGANSSFVNQVLDPDVPPETVARDPINIISSKQHIPNDRIPLPINILSNHRQNSIGFNIPNPSVLKTLTEARNTFKKHQWLASINDEVVNQHSIKIPILNPSDRADHVGDVIEATIEQADKALLIAHHDTANWRSKPIEQRANCLNKLAELYETHIEELIALECREAGKTLPDAINEVREAVDFCRYYAQRAQIDLNDKDIQGRGVFICISPWNFPLAIFTGQIVATLVAGNTVIAKPAEQTPLIAARAVTLMHEAGIPKEAIQLLPGDGATIGNQLVSSPLIGGVCFTGSTDTANIINKSMAQSADPSAPLIAETGGLNCMIVDSTALPEQVVGDIITSAFQSAGQRCSALRVLYLQVDIADKIIHMLKGAMDELAIDNPWKLTTDVGPVIDEDARQIIEAHCLALEKQGRLIKKIKPNTLNKGFYVAAAAYRIDSIKQLDKEIFGPVLHIATFESKDLEPLIETINATGYGLTMGIHTRIDHRVQRVCDTAKVGNLYINRNQIGAAVGIQPFGGEGLSGTGPKAGGPHYLYRFTRRTQPTESQPQQQMVSTQLNDEPNEKLIAILAQATTAQSQWNEQKHRINILQKIAKASNLALKTDIESALKNSHDYSQSALNMVGPTGESNQLFLHGRGVFLCAGNKTVQFATMALLTGNAVVLLDPSEKAHELVALALACGLDKNLVTLWQQPLNIDLLASIEGIAGVAITADQQSLKSYRKTMSQRPGPIIPLLSDYQDWRGFIIERSLCIDTTASGGNTALLANA